MAYVKAHYTPKLGVKTFLGTFKDLRYVMRAIEGSDESKPNTVDVVFTLIGGDDLDEEFSRHTDIVADYELEIEHEDGAKCVYTLEDALGICADDSVVCVGHSWAYRPLSQFSYCLCYEKKVDN